MENKLEQLTQKLFSEGLSKGRSEAEKVVSQAKDEASKIVEEAKKEGARIIEEAKKNAEECAKNTQTEIALASRQAIATLKEKIADMIVAKSSSEAIKKATLDPEFIKEVIIAVAKNWTSAQSGKISLEAMLPKDKEDEMNASFEKVVKELLNEGIEVGYSNKVKSGFTIAPKQGGYYISFTDDNFDALLGEYLRGKAYQILYKQE